MGFTEPEVILAMAETIIKADQERDEALLKYAGALEEIAERGYLLEDAYGVLCRLARLLPYGNAADADMVHNTIARLEKKLGLEAT